MRIYIEYDAQRYSLPSVQLRDGFYPAYVGSGEDVLGHLPPMEPAIWCKILILDSILINYDDKCIKWSTIKDQSDYNHVYWSNEECSGHEDEEELYDMAKDIIEKSFEDCKMLLLRMLHCYVLPKISFDIDDLKKVELARKGQLKNVQTLTNKLESLCFDVMDCQEKLDSMQEQFLPDIDKMINAGQCSKQLLEGFLCDLVDFERRVREKLAVAESHYAGLVPTDPATLKRSSMELLVARQERDFLDKKLVLILTAREEILDRKENLPQVTEAQGNDILQSYMDKRSTLQILKEEKNKLTQQQYCALMVRETLDSILTDLKDHGIASEDNADARGVRPTDVLQNALQPEWQTLSQRVATIVYNPKHPIGSLFERFCSYVHEICKDPYKLNEKTDIVKFSKSTFYVSLQPTEIMSDSDYVSVEMKTVVDPYKDKLFQIKENVALHLEKATRFLSEHFDNTESNFQNKLRVAYEHCFYEKTHKVLSWLYDQVYSQHMDDIKKDTQRITESFAANLLSLPVNMILGDVFDHSDLPVNGHLSYSVNGLSCSSINSQHNSEDRVETIGQNMSSSEDDLSCYSLQMDFSYNRSLDDMTNEERHKPLQSQVSKNRHYFINVLKDCCKATMLKHNDLGSLGCLIDEWDIKAKPIAESLEKSLSIENGEEKQQQRIFYTRQSSDETFQEYFQPALNHIKAVFKAVSPLQKLKHLHLSLEIISSKATEFQTCSQDRNSMTYEKCLPLLGLLLLQLQPCEVASLWIQLVMLEDLMAPFLYEGLYGQAMTHYQKILRVIDDLWLALSNGKIQCTVNGIGVANVA